MRSCHPLLTAAVLTLTVQLPVAQSLSENEPSSIDSDRDGMSDSLEQALLVQFRPTFMIGRQDCSDRPAEFAPGVRTPRVGEEDGTIYGQVFPGRASTPERPSAEIHFYHLWRRDCGGHGHPLDAEHVAVLVQESSSELASAQWKALYWYAAAHEDTVCDVSQIARASTLGPDNRGVTVWISPGKHASYFSRSLCRGGCGADRCEEMVSLPAGKLINVGEIGHPMNGSEFIASSSWVLAKKMEGTNFPADSLARLNHLPQGDIVLFHPGKHPAQGVIAISSSTEQAIAGGGHNTTSALSTAGESTGGAVSTATGSTGDALQNSYRNTRRALGTSLRHVSKALRPADTPKDSR
jgi:hypothetical protein